MSAQELRDAAKMLRERAEQATTPLPYWQALIGDSWGGSNAVGEGEGHPVAFVGEGDQAEADCHYIATMHPGVGLALADMLEACADGIERRGVTARITLTEAAAFDLARVILGGAS